MIASLPLQRARFTQRSVDVDRWTRTRDLAGWERDRVIWAESCHLPEVGVEIVNGLFASGFRLQSPSWETCVTLSLSEPCDTPMNCCRSSPELYQYSQEDRHALIIFIDTERFPQYRIDREFTFRDTLAEATIRHVNNICRNVVSSHQLSKLIHQLMERAFKANSSIGRPQGQYSSAIRRVADFVSDNLHRPIDRCELAITARLSEGHLSRLFRMETGQSLTSYLLSARLDRSRSLLWSKEKRPIKAIRQCCGFETESLFYTSFRRAYSMTPGEYRVAGHPETS